MLSMQIAEPAEAGDEPRAHKLLEAAAHMADRALLLRVASSVRRSNPTKFPIDYDAVRAEMDRVRDHLRTGSEPSAH